MVTRPAISLAQDRESSPAVTGVLTTMLRHYATQETRWSQAARNVNLNPSLSLKMHLQFYIYAVCVVSVICVM